LFEIFLRGALLHSVRVDSLPSVQRLVLDVKPPEGPVLRVMPSVVRKGDSFRCQFVARPGSENHLAKAQVVVRAMDGRAVWSSTSYPESNGVLEVVWDCRSSARRVVPGVYIVSVRHGRTALSQKFMIME